MEKAEGPKKKMGRPKKEIDQKTFESLCGLQCTIEEMADFFECDHKTISRWCKDTYGKRFSQVFRQKRAKGKISLRRKQMRLAGKNASMAIFLGKNYLGQRDEVEEPNAGQEAISIVDDVPAKEVKSHADEY